ncbi:hypothetical protein ACMFMG_011883 [Clarireedia jacksonii]
MFRTTHLLRQGPGASALRISIPIRTISSTRAARAGNWNGSPGKEHTTNDGDKYNVQHDASKLGREERAEGGTGEGASNATGIAEKDGQDSRSKTKKEHPKAPGPIIGMEDERGGKGA